MGLEKPTGIAARADEFYLMLDEKLGPIVVERIRQGALLAANLIGGAWQAAGAPNLADIRTRGSAEEPVVAQKLKPKDIIGSKNSTVFHHAECRFAKNIAPENLVRFPISPNLELALLRLGLRLRLGGVVLTLVDHLFCL
jgi:hypothetical protein